MTLAGIARDSVLSLFDVPERHLPRDRAAALLAAIESVQQKADLDQLTECAALAVLSLAAATATAVYFEAAELGPRLAFGGEVKGSAEAMAAALRDLASSGDGAPYLLFAGSMTVAVPFQAAGVRGALMATRKGPAFDDADGHTLAQFARHVGTAAASVALLKRGKRVERIGQAVLDTLCEGVLIAVDGRIQALNRAAARILGLDQESAEGTSLEAAWPELARLSAAGNPLELEPVRMRGREVRAGRRWDAAARRRGRAPPGDASQAAARPAGEVAHAAGIGPGPPSGRAHRRDQQHPPAQGGRSRAVPVRPLLPARRAPR